MQLAKESDSNLNFVSGREDGRTYNELLEILKDTGKEKECKI